MARPAQIIKRTGAMVPFTRGRIANAIYRAAVAVGGRDRSVAERLTDQVIDLLLEEFPPERVPHVEDVQNAVETVLIKNGHARTAKAYILYRDERSRRREERERRLARPTDEVPWRKLWHVLDWSVGHDLHTVDRLNARIERGEFADIVRETDKAYQTDIEDAADIVKERRGEVRIAIIAGPSSSGKTTTTLKLSQLLGGMGLSLVPLAVDNYFFDLEMHPKDEHGDYDYETPQALDLELIDDHLPRLLNGEKVMIPFYDFKTGHQYRDHTPMQVGPDDIILIDSLHGLYEGMTRSVEPERKFKLYIEPLMQIRGPDDTYVRWTDLRLMRRMERDATHRAYDPQQTLEHWHYVRSSELRHIIPFANTADCIVNSALPYELAIMRGRLLDSFAKWVEQYRDDPLRTDAYERAKRVHGLLSCVLPAEESLVPADSLLREFIGGSCYEY